MVLARRFALALAGVVMCSALWGLAPLPADAAALTVTNCNDSGAGSLRHAITTAASGDAIGFQAGMNCTIILTSGTLTIDRDLSIDGSGARITVDGNRSTRVFTIGVVAATLNALTIQHGGTVDVNGGSGIFNDGGTLTVANSVISGNSASACCLGTAADGGGISNSGIANVTSSTISGNEVGAREGASGGGIYTSGGTLTVTSSTFSGNSAQNFSGTGPGNSIVADSGTLTNTIIANAPAPNGGNLSGRFAGNNNLVDDDTISNLNGSNNVSAPAQLGTLGNYGGPTQTIPLLPGSPAIDAGAAVGSGPAGATVPSTDQRGMPRVGAPDIGAFEFDDPAVVTRVAVAPTSATIRVGEAVQLHATATYGDGHQADITATATWSSDAPGVASVDAGGKVTGKGAGTVHVTATQGGESGQASVTVAPPVLTGVQPAPAPQSRPSGASAPTRGTTPMAIPTGR